MKEEIVKGWAVKIVKNGTTRYVHDAPAMGTCYTADDTPCVFSSESKAFQVLKAYDKVCCMKDGAVVEVECRTRVKSWVKYHDTYMCTWLHIQAPHTTYMCTLRKLIKEGVVRLGDDGQWEVYE